MKIINENNTNITACKCGSVLEFTKEDYTTGQYGCACIICPNCDEKIFLQDIVPDWDKFEKHITKDNISFPQDFYDNSIFSNVDDESIENRIREGIEDIEQYGSDFYFNHIGNTAIYIFSDKDGYEVQVSKNYYDSFVNKERQLN